jgi:hypothetical protein
MTNKICDKHLSAILLLISCSSTPNTPPQNKPGSATVKAPEKPPEIKPASTSLPEPTPALALSLVEQNANKCEWKKLDPLSNQAKVIASFDVECRGAVFAFSPDKTRALAWFNPENGASSYGEEKMTPPFLTEEGNVTNPTYHLFEVEIETGKVTALPMPARGEVTDVSYNNLNEAFAFTQEEAKATKGEKRTIEFEGKQLPVFGIEGTPILVHAFKLKANKWEAFETKAGTSETDLATGLSALDSHLGLPKNTTQILTSHPAGEAAEGALLDRLKAYAPVLASRDGEWRQLGSSVIVWMVNIEFVFSTGKLVFDDGSKFIEFAGLGFTDGDIISPVLQGDYLLVAQASTGRSPRVYDIKHQRLLFSSDTARATVFWPK